jgi:hypothetical protein
MFGGYLTWGGWDWHYQPVVHFESGRAQKFTSPELHPPSLTPCLLDMLAVRPSLSSALPLMDRYGAVGCNGKGSLGCSPSVPDIAYIGRAGKWSNVWRIWRHLYISFYFNSTGPPWNGVMEHSPLSCKEWPWVLRPWSHPPNAAQQPEEK